MKRVAVLILCLCLSFAFSACRLGRKNTESDSLRLSRNTSSNQTRSSRSRRVNERVTSKTSKPSRSVETTTTPTTTTTTTVATTSTQPSREPVNSDFKAVVQYALDGGVDTSNSGAFNDIRLSEGRYSSAEQRVYFDYQLAAVAPHKENHTFDHWAYQIAVGNEIIENGDVNEQPSKNISRWVSLANAQKGEVRLIAVAVYSEVATSAQETSTSTETQAETTTTTTTPSSSETVEYAPATLQYYLDGATDPSNNNAFVDVSLNDYRVDSESSRVYYNYKLSEVVPQKDGYEFDHWAYQIVVGDRIIEDADLHEAPGAEISRWVSMADAKSNVRMIAVQNLEKQLNQAIARPQNRPQNQPQNQPQNRPQSLPQSLLQSLPQSLLVKQTS